MGAAAGGAVPYYASPSGDVVLYRGDATAVLRALPAGSVHACITSVPYLALRSYGTGPQVWGGDTDCPHEWGGEMIHRKGGVGQNKGLTNPVDSAVRQARDVEAQTLHQGAFCARCGAWRGELGLEPTPELYVEHIVAVFREVRRVLHPSGTCWVNIGDSYATQPVGTFNGGGPALTGRNLQGHHFKSPVDKSRLPGVKAKDLLMIPSRVAIALRDDGWWLRAMIPWLKRNAMPESATDRPTTATEYVFLLSKASSYFYDADAVRVPGGTTAEQATTKWATRREGRGKGQREGVYHPGAAPFANDPHPAGRNRRNADWWFDSLRAILAGATGLLADEDGAPLALPVNPAAYPGAHFATFAPRLVEPMVLASTSARGVCPACLAPYVRVTEPTGHVNGRELAHVPGNAATKVDSTGWAPTRRATDSWRAGCACDAGDPIPCTILDPFCGSGTVSLVARKHGRHSIGIDLSAAYLDMARERLGQLALPGLVAGG
jgi:DNA modification methylase